ncbi:MAG TPA: hypothetical protein PKK00_13965 [Bacteroidales bacterium]|nr:hypothetical protein [Bacteroidales bacterium]HPS18326.1 hypothetical protein [Bacteroidales bacterium]
MPNIQPQLIFTKGNFKLGCWGSQSINGDYSELDINATYNKGLFSFTVSDYFVFTDTPNESYFEYSKKNTDHSYEGNITYSGTEKFPLSISASTFFYGNDVDTSGNNYYSTYVEATYPLKYFDIILGATPAKGLYANGYGIVNTGLKVYHDIKITDHFSIPVCFSIMVNPYAERVFVAVGFTL